MAVYAVSAIRKMRGGAQSQLVLDGNGRCWVVKFQNNPQHLRVLANELIASRLAEAIGLSVPATDIVDVPQSLVEGDESMYIELPRGGKELYVHGQQFGSAFVGGLMPGQTVDYLPERQLMEVRNLREFFGILAFDKWTGNCDGRQAVFHRTSRERHYRAAFIDHGFCFNGGEWNFPDSAVRGRYARLSVYAGVAGWESFEPWLSRIESIDFATLWRIAEAVPPFWYCGDKASIGRLMQQLFDRRSRVRELIAVFRDSMYNPFPLWKS